MLITEKQAHIVNEKSTMKALKKAISEKEALIVSERDVSSRLRKTQEEKAEILQAQKETEAKIRSHLKEKEDLLAQKQAAINGIVEARKTVEVELKKEEKTTNALENQIAKKKFLITKEEYVAKCLHKMALHKRENLPPGAVAHFVDAWFGVQYRADCSMKFLLKETSLVSKYFKTQIREQKAAIYRRRDEALASATAAVCKRRDAARDAVLKQRDAARDAVLKRRDAARDAALALVPTVPTISVPTVSKASYNVCKAVVAKGPQSLLARLQSYGVNVDLFPKGYDPKGHGEKSESA